MSNYLVSDTDLQAVANAIRSKTGLTSAINFPTGFVNMISGIGGGITEYETGTWTPTSNTARGTINFSNTHTAPPSIVVMADTTNDNNVTTNTNFVFVFVDVYRTFGSIIPYSSATSAKRYSVVSYIFRGTSTTSLSNGNTLCTYSSDNTGDSSDSYSRYWATATNFKPSSNSTSRYWRSGRTYKWFAVWLPDNRPAT